MWIVTLVLPYIPVYVKHEPWLIVPEHMVVNKTQNVTFLLNSCFRKHCNCMDAWDATLKDQNYYGQLCP